MSGLHDDQKGAILVFTRETSFFLLLFAASLRWQPRTVVYDRVIGTYEDGSSVQESTVVGTVGLVSRTHPMQSCLPRGVCVGIALCLTVVGQVCFLPICRLPSSLKLVSRLKERDELDNYECCKFTLFVFSLPRTSRCLCGTTPRTPRSCAHILLKQSNSHHFCRLNRRFNRLGDCGDPFATFSSF
jgi:hypothetical protein